MISLFALVLSVLSPVFCTAATLSGPAITTIGSSSERLTFTSDGAITPSKVFTLPTPDRLVIDVPSIKKATLALPKGYNGALVKTIRFGQFNPTTSRVVVELKGPVAAMVGAHTGKGFAVDIAPIGLVKADKADKPVEVAKAPEKKVAMVEPVKKPAPDISAPVKKAKPDKKITVAAKPKEEPPRAKNPERGGLAFPRPRDDGAVSITGKEPRSARKSEVDKPLVMIDAGHGGQDPGAIGLHNTREKDITIIYARALREALLRTGRYRVAMTRDGDHFVKLPDRVAMARFVKADAFISFHADSNPKPEAKGLSIYTLSETASDEESAALAERENKADIIADVDLSDTDADVASILIDLTQRETMSKSANLADAMVATLHPSIDRLPKTHRFAGFRVLKAPDIPSVLVELGFLSNAADEKRLLSATNRATLVDSIVKGIDRYLGK